MHTGPDLHAIRAIIRRAKRRDQWFAWLGFAATFGSIAVLVALFADLAMDGIGRLNWDFFTHYPSRHAHAAGILPAWVGSLAVILVTGASSVPLGIGAAIWLEEYAPRNGFTDIIEINVTNLAGVPSIIYGLLALGLFVQIFGLGESILAAGLTLGLLILPIVIVATREAIRSVPIGMREAAYALGATRWQTTSHHVVPYALPGILTGVIIGISRAIGETAPIITIGALTFIAFLPHAPVTQSFPYLSFEWLFDPFTVMPIQMFSWLSRPQAEFLENAAAAGMVIILMTLALNAIAIFIRYRYRKKIKW